MALLISNAILHIINNSGTGTSFSNVELDVDSETCYDFIARHVRRLLNNPAAKEATFTAQSRVYEMVKAYQKGNMFFKELSLHLCERLAEIMMENKEIPPADILVAAFDNRDKRYIAILKLNYAECFTHRVVEGENGTENQIIKNTVVLPMSGAKVEEACLIPYDPMILRILEKPYPVNGEMTDYFSGLFLECETERSRKETMELLEDIVEEVSVKYYGDDVERAARVKTALIEEAAEDPEEGLNLENAARRAFYQQEEASREFVEKAKEAGLPFQVPLDKPFVQREFKTERFKADNGIEVKFPLELVQDPETVQIVSNSDGTVSITLKNLRRHSQE